MTMQATNITPFRPKPSVPVGEHTVSDSVRWMQNELNKAQQEAAESLQRLRLRERVCRAELRDLFAALARNSRLGLETVTLEVQIQRRQEETTLCRHQANMMEQHLEVLSQRIDRTTQYACVN
jgi:hypothetical protein